MLIWWQRKAEFSRVGFTHNMEVKAEESCALNAQHKRPPRKLGLTRVGLRTSSSRADLPPALTGR